MENNISIDKFSPPPNTGKSAKNMIQEFNAAVQELAQTKNSLKSEVGALKDELSNLRKERDILETDMGQVRELSDIAMAAKASEEEKQDALKKNQELRSYLDSAADKIKSLDIQFDREHNEVRRLQNRIDLAEKEKAALLRDREDFQIKMSGMDNMLREQDYQIKSLNLKLVTAEDDKINLENEHASTKKAMGDIQKSMDEIKDKMRKGHFAV